MVQYFLSGGILMVPIYFSLIFLIFISIKNLKSAYHIDKIILIGSLTVIFGIISTAVGIRNAWSIAPSFSKIAPHILLHGLKTSLVTTFAGGLILFFSTLSISAVRDTMALFFLLLLRRCGSLPIKYRLASRIELNGLTWLGSELAASSFQ